MNISSISSPSSPKKGFLSSKYIGFVYALIAHFSLCFAGFVIKKSQSTLSSTQVQFYLGLQLALYSYAICKQQNVSVTPKDTKTARLLMIRGVLGFFGTLTYILALKYLPLSEAIVINNTLPVFTGFFAVMYLGEKYDTTLAINTGMSLIGVILISKPSFIFPQNDSAADGFEFRQYGLICILLSTISGATITILLKKLGNALHPAVTVFHLGVMNVVIASISMIMDGKVDIDLKSCIALGVIGLTWTFGQALQGLSYRFGDASRIVVAMYAQVVFSFMFEIVLDGLLPDIFQIMGSACIVSGFFVVFYKISQQDKMRKVSILLPVESL